MIIYSILNTINGKRYIGKSANFKRRWRHHQTALKNNKHHNTHLQASYHKYGPVFLFTILETAESEEELNQREMFWIQHFQTFDKTKGFNSTFGGDGVIPTEETRLKISRTMKDRGTCKGRNNPQWGKPRTQEEKDKQSRAMKGRTLTPEHKARIRAGMLKRRQQQENAA